MQGPEEVLRRAAPGDAAAACGASCGEGRGGVTRGCDEGAVTCVTRGGRAEQQMPQEWPRVAVAVARPEKCPAPTRVRLR